jgi:hypothetical protein
MLFMPNGFADFRLKIMQLALKVSFFDGKKISSVELARLWSSLRGVSLRYIQGFLCASVLRGFRFPSSSI